jgi:hypothetical protein
VSVSAGGESRGDGPALRAERNTEPRSVERHPSQSKNGTGLVRMWVRQARIDGGDVPGRDLKRERPDA